MERRESQRFETVFPVWVASDAFGECAGVARNISEQGMFVEMADPLPLGARVRIHFALPEARGALIAVGEVKRHYFLQYSDSTGPRALTGMGIRFTGYEDVQLDDFEAPDPDVWRSRVLH